MSLFKKFTLGLSVTGMVVGIAMAAAHRLMPKQLRSGSHPAIHQRLFMQG
jgi:hypothetical protein